MFQCWQCCTPVCFRNEKGKILSGEAKDSAGLCVCCGELGGASKRARETGSATYAHNLADICHQLCEATQLQKHLSLKLLVFGYFLWFFSPQLIGAE